MKAQAGRDSLARLGQHLMQKALHTPLKKVEKMLAEQEGCVSQDFDDRPRYSLMVIHMALQWLSALCGELRLTDAATELQNLKTALTLVTRPGSTEKAEPSNSLTSILGQSQTTEIDQFVLHLIDLAVESGAILKDEALTQQRSSRRPWLSPRTDYMVAGNLIYLDGKTCHSRYLEWCRSTGLRTPLTAWSDVKQLIEHEPYFVEWRSLPDFAFGQPALTLSIEALQMRNISVEPMRRVYDVFGKVELDSEGNL